MANTVSVLLQNQKNLSCFGNRGLWLIATTATLDADLQERGVSMSAFAIRGHAAAAARASGPKLVLGALTAVAFAWGAQPAQAYYVFQDVVNMTDPTFNQELGINNSDKISGYFGSGMAGHPNQGY